MAIRVLSTGTSPVVQWLRLPSNAGGAGSITGLGTKIPHAARCGQKQKNKQKECPAPWGDLTRNLDVKPVIQGSKHTFSFPPEPLVSFIRTPTKVPMVILSLHHKFRPDSERS